MNGFPILSAILFVPLVGVIGAAVLPRVAGWGWALAAAVADLALCLILIAQFSTGASGMQFAEHAPWLPDLGINYALGVDGVNLFLVALNALLTAVAIGASLSIARTHDRSREYFALIMLLSVGMQGVFLATNLFLFYVFWELMLVPAYLLVGIFGGARRGYAAIKFVLYTAVGSLLMLVGIIAVGALVSAASHQPFSLDLAALQANGVAGITADTQIWLFLAFSAAFAVKAGIFPLHSWAPDAYGESPYAVAALLSGVMAKTGAYGFIRFNLELFPRAAHDLTPLMEILAVIGILYFALQAVVAQDFKRLLAYISLSHMGVIVLATFALNVQGVEGAVVQMVNHGIVIAALFLIAGFIEARTGSRRLADFGGMATRVPWLATAFFLAALSALGLPGLNSFAGEFLAFLGTFRASIVFGTLGTLVTIPAAWYMLRFFQGVMEGQQSSLIESASSGVPVQSERKQPKTGLVDLRRGELGVLLPLLALIVVLGVIPGVLTARIERSAQQLLPRASAAANPIVTPGLSYNSSTQLAPGEYSSVVWSSSDRSGESA